MYLMLRQIVIASFVLAIPFYVCWTLYGIGGAYFFFLPSAWHSIPYMKCVGMFLSVFILRFVFVPRLVVVHKDA